MQFVSLNSACWIDKFRRKEAVIDPAAFGRALAAADADKQPVRIAVWHHAVLGRWSMTDADGYLQRLAAAEFAMLLLRGCPRDAGAGGRYFVARGGSWPSSYFACRCASRFNYFPEGRLNDIGFRCART